MWQKIYKKVVEKSCKIIIKICKKQQETNRQFAKTLNKQQKKEVENLTEQQQKRSRKLNKMLVESEQKTQPNSFKKGVAKQYHCEKSSLILEKGRIIVVKEQHKSYKNQVENQQCL